MIYIQAEFTHLYKYAYRSGGMNLLEIEVRYWNLDEEEYWSLYEYNHGEFTEIWQKREYMKYWHRGEPRNASG